MNIIDTSSSPLIANEEEMIKNNTIPGNAKESIWNIIKRCTLTESEEIELYKYVKRKKLI